MPISGVNLTPRPTAVYASDPALPRSPQDSLPSCLLGFERTRLALASSYQLSYRTPHPALVVPQRSDGDMRPQAGTILADPPSLALVAAGLPHRLKYLLRFPRRFGWEKKPQGLTVRLSHRPAIETFRPDVPGCDPPFGVEPQDGV